MILMGVLWAAFAPISLLLLSLAVKLAGKKLGWSIAWWHAALAVAVPVVAVYGADRLQFQSLCEELGSAKIARSASSDGFFLDSGTANSFGTRYLTEEGFQWFETRDIYRAKGWSRYEVDSNGEINVTPIEDLTARFEVRERWDRRSGASISLVEVRDRSDGSLMSSASSAHFDGGKLKWVLGAWGVSQCPNPGRGGDTGFDEFYHVVRNTLKR